jgi:hypothetical protein
MKDIHLSMKDPNDVHMIYYAIQKISNWTLLNIFLWRSFVTTDAQSATPSWCPAPIWNPWPDFCFLSYNCGFLCVGRLLLRENLLLQLLLGLARAVTLRSNSCRTHDHVLLLHIRLLQPRRPGLHLYCRDRVAQLYLRALGSLFVASYDSQGYCGGILIRLHRGESVSLKL